MEHQRWSWPCDLSGPPLGGAGPHVQVGSTSAAPQKDFLKIDPASLRVTADEGWGFELWAVAFAPVLASNAKFGRFRIIRIFRLF